MIIHSDSFHIQQIADSGQCFRMNRIGDNRYGLIAFSRYIELTQIDQNSIEISCTEEEFSQIWEDYFDLQYDYGQLTANLMKGKDEFLAKAAAYGRGIRILRQEPFEMLISFIISQNKNIPSIKKCIEGICRRYGERRISKECGGKEYYTFPTPAALVMAKQEELRELKLGYRDTYVIQAAKAVAQGSIDLYSLMGCSHREAVDILMTLPGVGSKVANCISLYGLHHIEAFPVDVWIKKVIEEIYHSDFQVDQYKGYAGIVQQYMFYYMRSMGMKEKLPKRTMD